MKSLSRPLSHVVCALLILAVILTSCNPGDSAHPAIPQGGTLTLFDTAPPTLDPAIAASDMSLTYIVEIFSGLVSFNPELALTPDIAEDWDTSSDGTVYTFHLRQEALRHRKLSSRMSSYQQHRIRAPSAQFPREH